MTTTEAFSEVSPPSRFGLISNSPSVLEPYIHWSKTTHLAEDLLLAGFGSNRLSQKLANFT